MFIIGLFALLGLSACSAENKQPSSQPDAQIILHKSIYNIQANQTYTAVITDEFKLLTTQGINDNKQYQIGFFPDSQKIDWVKASIVQPSGAVLEVPQENMRIQPIFADSSAASLSNMQVMTITFPQLRLGSKVTVTYQLTRTKANFSFNIADQPNFNYPNAKRIIILNFPKSLPIKISQHGGYSVKRKQAKEKIYVVAELLNQPRHFIQANMVDYQDVLPLFSASNFQTWQQIGNDFWQGAKSKIIVDQNIKELAKSIIGDRVGLAAARAIYNWVINNIYYISVNLNESDSLIPQSSLETLNNRYGDCKAIVILLEALYQAVGINSQPVLIAWNNSYRPFPAANIYQFNHAILYLPDYKLFVNSTDRYAPFAVLESGLQNKLVVISSAKSVVAQTPSGKPQENTYQANQSVTIQADGTLIGSSDMHARGTIAIGMRSQLANALRQTKLLEIANQALRSSTYGGFGKFSISNLENLDQPFIVKASWHSPQAIHIGKHLFLLLPKGPQYVSIDSARDLIFEKNIQYPITVSSGSYYWHDIVIAPTNYHFQLLPQTVSLSNSAGNYSSQYKLLSPSKIEVIRQLIFEKDYYKPEEYKDLKAIAAQAVRDTTDVLYLEQVKN